jgi:hypothetical protein
LVLNQALGKSGQMPAFSITSKVAVPKLKFWNSLQGLKNFRGPDGRGAKLGIHRKGRKGQGQGNYQRQKGQGYAHTKVVVSR